MWCGAAAGLEHVTGNCGVPAPLGHFPGGLLDGLGQVGSSTPAARSPRAHTRLSSPKRPMTRPAWLRPRRGKFSTAAASADRSGRGGTFISPGCPSRCGTRSWLTPRERPGGWRGQSGRISKRLVIGTPCPARGPGTPGHSGTIFKTARDRYACRAWRASEQYSCRQLDGVGDRRRAMSRRAPGARPRCACRSSGARSCGAHRSPPPRSPVTCWRFLRRM